MRSFKQDRIRELLRQLEELDAREARGDAARAAEWMREAIVDELALLANEDGLTVYRRGRSLEAVSLAG